MIGFWIIKGKVYELMNKASEFTLHIEAGKTDRQYFKDLWRYRELFYFLSWRDILVRFKQTVIGVLWAILRPFITMVVFTVVFSNIAKLPSDGNAPYPILVYAAMLPWQFFSSALSESSNSLIANSNMISKIYFPRLMICTLGQYSSAAAFYSYSLFSGYGMRIMVIRPECEV